MTYMTPRHRRCFAGGTAAALVLGATLTPASAALVLAPSSGVELAYSTDINEDGGASGSRPLTGSFFGFGVSGITPSISLNGYISFGGASPLYDPMRLGESGGDRIAPLWFDFGVGASSRILEHSGSSYYGVTWQDLTVPGQSELASFQAIFFEDNTTLHGQDFLAGDIVFSYGDLSFYQSVPELVIGLEEMLGEYVGLPPGDFPEMDLQGWHSYQATGGIPVGDDELVLFRPDGSGGYTVSLTPIPEPSVNLLIVPGLIALWRRRRS